MIHSNISIARLKGTLVPSGSSQGSKSEYVTCNYITDLSLKKDEEMLHLSTLSDKSRLI